jgi:hypothetical protein
MAAFFSSLLVGGIIAIAVYEAEGSIAVSAIIFALGFTSLFASLIVILEPSAILKLVRDEFGIDLKYNQARKIAFLFNGTIKIKSGQNKGKSKSREQYIKDIQKSLKGELNKNKLFDHASIRASRILFEANEYDAEKKTENTNSRQYSRKNDENIDELFKKWNLPENCDISKLKKWYHKEMMNCHPDHLGPDVTEKEKHEADEKASDIISDYHKMENILKKAENK